MDRPPHGRVDEWNRRADGRTIHQFRIHVITIFHEDYIQITVVGLGKLEIRVDAKLGSKRI